MGYALIFDDTVNKWYVAKIKTKNKTAIAEQTIYPDLFFNSYEEAKEFVALLNEFEEE